MKQKDHEKFESIERHCKNIERNEKCIQAFVDNTLDCTRIRDHFLRLQENHSPPLPALFGVLVGVKDIIQVDGFLTRCGSAFPTEMLTSAEAPLVTSLKQAGAIIAGKTHTTEFAISDPGPTRNPLNPAHTPGGSSSGSAAAVAADFCDLAIGTQTAGSVIRPAAYCGVIGYKPSFGRISTEGVFPYSRTLDHVGLYARHIDGIERAMAAIDSDWKSAPAIDDSEIRAAIPAGPYLEIASISALQHFGVVIQKIRDANFSVESRQVLDNIDQYNTAVDQIGAAEVYRIHEPWFDQYREWYQPLSLKELEIGKAISDNKLGDLQRAAKQAQLQMQQTMHDAAVDVWLAPSAPDVAPEGLAYTGDHRMNSIWSYSGLPVITIPTGRNHQNLAYGMQIVGRFGHDESLLQIAKRLQQRIV